MQLKVWLRNLLKSKGCGYMPELPDLCKIVLIELKSVEIPMEYDVRKYFVACCHWLYPTRHIMTKEYCGWLPLSGSIKVKQIQLARSNRFMMNMVKNIQTLGTKVIISPRIF